jgi:hypothetical protein
MGGLDNMIMNNILQEKKNVVHTNPTSPFKTNKSYSREKFSFQTLFTSSPFKDP